MGTSAVDPTPRPFTPRDRKASLISRGIEQQAIAAELGVSHFVVCRVVAGRSLCSAAARKVARRIAEIIGQPVELVFPEWQGW